MKKEKKSPVELQRDGRAVNVSNKVAMRRARGRGGTERAGLVRCPSETETARAIRGEAALEGVLSGDGHAHDYHFALEGFIT
jgi:hypothetical protein